MQYFEFLYYQKSYISRVMIHSDNSVIASVTQQNVLDSVTLQSAVYLCIIVNLKSDFARYWNVQLLYRSVLVLLGACHNHNHKIGV